MENEKNTILVTWDFTEKSEYALEYAILMSKRVNSEITLINIVKKSKEIESTIDKLKAIADFIHKKNHIKPSVIAREGTIFTTINEVAEEIGANMVIMGTHGIKGMQKLTGSWALKVIAGSKVPFVVVQKSPEKDQFTNILFPMDFKQESKEKLYWANYLAQFYHLKLMIITPNTTDEALLQKIKANVSFAKKFLDTKGIQYDILQAQGKESFENETIEYAKIINADLILIMTTRGISFEDYVLGASEQKIIANKYAIPVMCVNPRTDLGKFGGFN